MKLIGRRLTGFDVKISIVKKLKIVATLLSGNNRKLQMLFCINVLYLHNLSQKREQGAENCENQIPSKSNIGDYN